MLENLTLTPVSGIALLLVMLICGRQFRENWKKQEQGWERRAWLYAVPAAFAFALLAFVPMQIG